MSASKEFLEGVGLLSAWGIFNADRNEQEMNRWIDSKGEQIYEYETLVSIVGNLKSRGSLSDKQVEFLKSLVAKLENSREETEEREKEWAAQSEAADDVPEGRMEVTGQVLSMKMHTDGYGSRMKMLVAPEGGFKIWGSVPSSLDCEKGDRIQFTATLEASDDDPKFGFFKRPSKAKVIGWEHYEGESE